MKALKFFSSMIATLLATILALAHVKSDKPIGDRIKTEPHSEEICHNDSPGLAYEGQIPAASGIAKAISFGRGDDSENL